MNYVNPWAPVPGAASHRAEPLRMEFRGHKACFTQPMAGTERVSHPIATPSAVAQMLKTFFRKSEFEFVPLSVSLLSPIQYWRTTQQMLLRKSAADITNGGHKTLRSTVFLREVHFGVEFDIAPNPYRSPGGRRYHGRDRRVIEDIDAYSSYRAEFRTRVQRSHPETVPFLGLKCAPASHWRLLEPGEKFAPLPVSMPLGQMLLGLKPNQKDSGLERVFFNAELVDGVLTVPVEQWTRELLPSLWEARAINGKTWRS